MWGNMTKSVRLVDFDMPAGHTGEKALGAAGLIELEPRQTSELKMEIWEPSSCR